MVIFLDGFLLALHYFLMSIFPGLILQHLNYFNPAAPNTSRHLQKKHGFNADKEAGVLDK